MNDLLVTLRLFMIFLALDNWPVFLEMNYCRRFFSSAVAARLESAVTRAVLALANAIGNAAGLRAVDERFTPKLLPKWNEKLRPKNA